MFPLPGIADKVHNQSTLTLAAVVTRLATNNQISGSLPQEWSKMTSLMGLELKLNEITGTLHPQWSTLSLMHIFASKDLAEPETFADCCACTISDGFVCSSAGANKLTGTLPVEYSEWTQAMDYSHYE
eukprot:scaffold106042_cov42-Prasinocladus_malaysianus.AAC.4